MVEFSLPASSKVKEGKTWPAPAGAKRTKTFRVYRWNPDDGENPRVDTYDVDLDDCGPMMLDALIKIKNEIDSTLTFRRSCREGVCGSCAMNIDGTNTLACTKYIERRHGRREGLSAAASCRWSRTWCPTSTTAYAQYASIEPWLKTTSPAPDRERLQSQDDRAEARRPLRVHPVLLLLDRLPELLVERRPLPRPGDPAAGLPLDRRQPRRSHRRAARPARGSVPALPLPHHHELHQDLPQGAEPGQGDRRDQEADGGETLDQSAIG